MTRAGAILLCVACLLMPAPRIAAQQPVRLPARFQSDRVFVMGITPRGDTLSFYTDTGGGANMLAPAVAARLAMRVDTMRQGTDTMRLVDWPARREAADIPPPSPEAPFSGRLMLMSPPPELGGDGFLGRTWFATRIWRFDYPGRELWLLPSGAPGGSGAHTVPLGFQVDSTGRRTTHFPRIEAVVDGDTLQFLFDTGATLAVADSARAALGNPAHSEVGTSFITNELFQRWRGRHADWPVVERGERGTGASLIRVANVRVAGHDTGPVWFTVRPDRAFHQFMSQWMDRRVDGALGGSAFRPFRITVDYPNASATFERP